MGDVKTKYPALLNKLFAMQGSFVYAARRDVLVEAENTIVSLEQQLATLKAEKDKHERDILQVIDERDKAQDVILECAQLFGEQYEWFASIPGELPPDSGDLHKDLPCLIKELQAEKERLERNECPHCDGGEVYVGSRFPDDEGFTTCETCEGSALLPNADDIRIMRNKLREMQGDLQAYEQGQIPAYQDRIKELEGELGRLREQKVTPLNEHTRYILGRPCFVFIQYAEFLRQHGHQIGRSAEDEQAYCIHLMLNLYEKHGENWRDEFSKYLQHPTQEPTNGS